MLGNEGKVETAEYNIFYNIDRKNKFYHVFRFIQRCYGSDIDKALKRINTILLLVLSTEFVKNKRIKSILKSIQYGIPAGIFTIEFYQNLTKYIEENKKDNDDAYHKKAYIFSNILGVSKTNEHYGHFNSYDFQLSTEIIMWILHKPKTKSIKILKFYDLEGKELPTIEIDNEIKRKEVFILMQSGDIRFIIGAVFSNYTESLHVTESRVYKEHSYAAEEEKEIFNQIRIELTHDFISTLDIKKNFLKFEGFYNIESHPRIKVTEEINQFNVNDLLIEIKNVLNIGRRRSYAFVGKQGVGKSSILRKITELTRDFIVIYISPDDFYSVNRIKEKFDIIKSLGKCIIIIEDLDGYGFEEKNERATAFLNEIDDVNNDLNAVILVTINETNKIHKSIIDRPGRFDRVIEIKPPMNSEEVYQVMLSKFSRLKPIYCPDSKFSMPDLNFMNRALLKKCIDRDFTQAEISNAIMEQIFLDCKRDIDDNGHNWDNINLTSFNHMFEKAISVHIKTKEAIKNSDFSTKEDLEISPGTPGKSCTPGRAIEY